MHLCLAFCKSPVGTLSRWPFAIVCVWLVLGHQGCRGHGKVMEFLEFKKILEFLEKSISHGI